MSTVTYTSTLTQAVLTVYSKDIMFAAAPILRYAQFATKKTELGVNPGLTMTFMKYNNLTIGGVLVENVDMETQLLTASQIPITVTEYGNAISVSEKLLQSSFDDVLASGARLLGMDYAKVLDVMLRDVLMGSDNVIYGGDKATRLLLGEGDLFDSALLKDAVEYMETANVRKWNGDAYICFLHPHQARGLKDDPDFKNAKDYGAIYAGEIGRVDDVIFVSTTQQPIVAHGGVGANSTYDVYRAVMFGDNAYGFAEALPVEMRDGGIKDFGRKHDLAWYSIMGGGLIEELNTLILETI